jgi:arylformamidase
MNIIDISWPLCKGITEYKDVKTFGASSIKTMEQDGVRQAVFTMSNHSGTHVDAPAHFLPDGETIENVSLYNLVGQCRLLDFTHCGDNITLDDITSQTIEPGEIILFKTKNSFYHDKEGFQYNFVYVDSQAAQYLAGLAIKAIGIDYLGIERNQPDHATHTALMANNIPIIEGLRLAHVQAGSYFLVCLPLLMPGLDASPARAILISDF